MFRRALVGAASLTVIAAGISFAAAPAQATSCPIDRQCTTTYYNNAAHSTVIGQAGYHCGAQFWQWGQTSVYWTKVITGCA
jgi:Family of unknown function (DUF6289)